jgi:uncharacterized protein YoxC
MEVQALIEIGKQVPALAVLTFLVVFFLKHLNSISDRVESRLSEQNARLVDVISKSTESTERSNVLMDRLEMLIRHLNGKG